MDNEALVKGLVKAVKEHERRIILLSSKVKWLEKERAANKLYIKALHTRLDNLKESDVRRMV